MDFFSRGIHKEKHFIILNDRVNQWKELIPVFLRIPKSFVSYKKFRDTESNTDPTIDDLGHVQLENNDNFHE